MRKILARVVRGAEKKYGRELELVIQHNESQSTVVGLSRDEAVQALRALAPLVRAPHAGRSILDIFWEELDSIMDILMLEGAPASWVEDQDPNPHSPEAVGIASDWQQYGEERGKAQGLAYCIAILTSFYEPSVPAIKKEAARRWRERHAGE